MMVSNVSFGASSVPELLHYERSCGRNISQKKEESQMILINSIQYPHWGFFRLVFSDSTSPINAHEIIVQSSNLPRPRIWQATKTESQFPIKFSDMFCLSSFLWAIIFTRSFDLPFYKSNTHVFQDTLDQPTTSNRRVGLVE